jgi:hypothetical protein
MRQVDSPMRCGCWGRVARDRSTRRAALASHPATDQGTCEKSGHDNRFLLYRFHRPPRTKATELHGRFSSASLAALKTGGRSNKTIRRTNVAFVAGCSLGRQMLPGGRLMRRLTEPCCYVRQLIRFSLAHVPVRDNGELQPHRLTRSVYR